MTTYRTYSIEPEVLEYRLKCDKPYICLDTHKFCREKDCDYKTDFYGHGCFCRYKDFKDGDIILMRMKPKTTLKKYKKR